MRGNALEDSIMMKKTHFLVRATVIAVVLASLGACAMNRTQRNAAANRSQGATPCRAFLKIDPETVRK